MQINSLARCLSTSEHLVMPRTPAGRLTHRPVGVGLGDSPPADVKSYQPHSNQLSTLSEGATG